MPLPAYFRRFILVALLLVGGLVLLSVSGAKAQSNTVDPVFGGAGLGLAGTVQRLALQSDGKLLVAGGINGLYRLNTDGSTDTNFNADINQIPSAVVVQNDGKIILLTGSDSSTLVRLNTDGTLDTSFAGAPDLDEVETIVPQSDGKIMIGASALTGGNGIYRLNTDGTLDSSFNANISGSAATFPAVSAIFVQTDGKYVVGGVFTQIDGVASNGFARLNIDGTLDGTFNPVLGMFVHPVFIQGDGKILVTNPLLTRLNSDGSVDTTFNCSALGDFIALEPNSQIVLFYGGDSSSKAGTLTLVNTDGSVASSFSFSFANTIVPEDASVASVIAQADGTFLIGGPFTQVNTILCNSVAKLDADGSVDTNYTPDAASGPNGAVTQIALQSDGKIIISGNFDEVAGTSGDGVARLKTDGTRDPSFNPNIVSDADGSIRYSVAEEANDQLLVGGFFSSVDGVSLSTVARLNEDGTLDTTFSGFSSYSSDGQGFTNITVQPDGKIIGSPVNEYEPGKQFSLVRLNSDGTVDSSFNAAPPSTGSDVFISAVQVQADGKILVGFGEIFNNGQTVYRLNADGSVDSAFSPALGSDYNIFSLAAQPDGSVVLGGVQAVSGGADVSPYFLTRLDANGAVDPSFNVSIDGTVDAILLNSDGTFVIGGSFANINGQPRRGLAHLAADGRLNPYVPTESGVDGNVNTLVQQPDGKVLIGGNFSMVNGVERNYVARLTNGGTPDFFGSGVPVGGGFYYLEFPNGTPFGYYNLAGNGYAFPYFYHADLGMEYFFDANDSQGGAYMYDFASNDFFYTSPSFAWPLFVRLQLEVGLVLLP